MLLRIGIRNGRGQDVNVQRGDMLVFNEHGLSIRSERPADTTILFHDEDTGENYVTLPIWSDAVRPSRAHMTAFMQAISAFSGLNFELVTDQADQKKFAVTYRVI